MESKPSDSTPASYQATPPATALLFLGGSGAGAIAFILFGGIWQVNHFWWVMGATTFSCGLLAVWLRQNFKNVLNALLDNAPWI